MAIDVEGQKQIDRNLRNWRRQKYKMQRIVQSSKMQVNTRIVCDKLAFSNSFLQSFHRNDIAQHCTYTDIHSHSITIFAQSPLLLLSWTSATSKQVSTKLILAAKISLYTFATAKSAYARMDGSPSRSVEQHTSSIDLAG